MCWAVVCGGVMFGAVGCASVHPPPKSTIKFVSKPRSMQPTHTPKALPGRLPPPRVPKMVRPNKYGAPWCVCYAPFFALIFASLLLIFRDQY